MNSFVAELKQEVADLDPVVGLEGDPFADLLAVDERVIAALQVLDIVRAVLHRNPGVLATDGMVRDDDLALLLIPANHLRLAGQLDVPVRARPFG